MAFKDIFFVQTFNFTGKNRLTLLATYQVSGAEQAVARAQAYVERGVPGAVAFRQMVDIEADDVQEPTLLAAFGSVPPEAQAAA